MDDMVTPYDKEKCQFKTVCSSLDCSGCSCRGCTTPCEWEDGSGCCEEDDE